MKQNSKKSLKHFQDAALTKKEAHQVDGSWSFDEQLAFIKEELRTGQRAGGRRMREAISLFFTRFFNLHCYGNINGLNQ